MMMASTVERTVLGDTLSISRALTGLWQIADLERDGKTIDLSAAAASMDQYVAAGFTTFDMADHYGSAELIAGRYRSTVGKGKEIQFCTKWVPKPGPVNREDVRAAVQRAVERTGGRPIDLMQFHTWNYTDPSWLDALFYLQELRSEGLLLNLGVTNFDTAHLRIAVASGIPIASNQVSFSLIDQRAAGALSAYCLAHGIRILAYGTVAGGWLTEKWSNAAEPDQDDHRSWSQSKYGRFLHEAGGWPALQKLLQVLTVIAKRHGVSVANVASRYILEQPAVAGVIIGARLGVSEHVADNLRLFSFSLTPEDRAEIGALLATLRPIPGDTGDEYRKRPFLTASGDLSHHLQSFPPAYEVRRSGNGRMFCLSGTPWESFAGYARAVRQGNRIHVSGTTATHGDRVMGGNDAAAQTHFVIDKIEGALRSLGGALEDVVRTRIFVSDMKAWEAVARAHGERFADIRPANTLVNAALVGKDYLVEIEAEAEIGKAD
jgi:aryl-alcohol dehydrogenase-like predicted oxidoreductase/enamine deaminase RidA (YjgF/YER057c/UK114 family)